MNQKEAFEIAKVFLDSEAEAFDDARIELGKNQDYSVSLSFNYLTAKDVAVLAQIEKDNEKLGFLVEDGQVKVFTPEGE
jgi:hypothetical protein